MIFPETFESKLGFDLLRKRLLGFCKSTASERLVVAMKFEVRFEVILQQLKQVNEFKTLDERSLDFPARHFFDPENWFLRAAIEGNFLDEKDFVQLSQSLQSIASCKLFLNKHQEDFPELFNLSLPLSDLSFLNKEILSKIDEQSFVKDSASVELSSIRRKLREEQMKLRKMAEQLFKMAVHEKWVPEGALPTVRDGRIVIPILAEHKRKLKGFIQDESATGQTVFMEPVEMLDANNEIRDLEHAQRREVVKILIGLTALVRENLSSLRISFDFHAIIDFIRAKAKLANELQSSLPLMENKPIVDWHSARHPLLFLSYKGKREVVPLSLQLSSLSKMILISGPNAGGKSVCLKTIGLLQYMVQCGLLIPVADHSRVGIFKAIFLDIGDQQSIENDLSTYSSHLSNMKFFLENATDTSLVLLDELGSGTDPNFGGAIAQAILSSLVNKQVWGVATTHYYNLKLFAESHTGIRNAAMRFDEERMQPLYQLEIGKPGSSFALEIAYKIGLPTNALQDAESLVGVELAGFEKLSRSLEKERLEHSEKKKKLDEVQEELKQVLNRYNSLSEELEKKKKEILKQAKEEAMLLLKTTNKEIEKTIRHIQENKAEKKETMKVRKSLQDLSRQVSKGLMVTVPKQENKLDEGDRVRIIGQSGSGILLTIQGKNAIVQLGELKSTVALSKLEKVEGALQKDLAIKLKTSGINLYERQATFNSSLDVRGKRVDEIVSIVDSFIDSAILLGQGELRILHGKGEGVLRKVIREQLKKYKEVASLRDEHVDRGGDGITIVVLK